ncbi:MAG: hypothetical protein ACOX0I_04230 [Bacilli bacterium]|jgi:hypothetical protein
MTDERCSKIAIGGKEYELLLTTRATKEIGKKYGGLSDLGDKLLKAENFETAIDELIWLITLLANQPILIHNAKNPQDKKDLLEPETVELFTTPYEIAGFKEAIMDCLIKGTKREVQSEESKNG